MINFLKYGGFYLLKAACDGANIILKWVILL